MPDLEDDLDAIDQAGVFGGPIPADDDFEQLVEAAMQVHQFSRPEALRWLTKNTAGRDYARRYFNKLATRPAAQQQPDKEVGEGAGKTDGDAVDRLVQRLIEASGGEMTRQAVLYALHHTASGQQLLRMAIGKSETKESENTMTPVQKLIDYAKGGGDVVAIAKRALDHNDAFGFSETDAFNLISARANVDKRAGETDAQAFGRWYGGNDERGTVLRKFSHLCKSAQGGSYPFPPL